MIYLNKKAVVGGCISAVAVAIIIGCGIISSAEAAEGGIHVSSISGAEYDTSQLSVDTGSDFGEFEEIDWENFQADPYEEFTTVTVDEALTTSTFTDSTSSFSEYHMANVSMPDAQKIMLDEDSAWKLISGGLYSSYPSGNYLANEATLNKIYKNAASTITVDCWYWEDPNDQTNMNKVTVKKTFTVNAAIASLFENAFRDIYNDPSKPVINIADRGMGTWCIRGKNHNKYARMSTHALGCCIDINPSTASFYVNGKWYGNAYGQRAMSKEIWKQLPECHKKYHVLYAGSPIVEIFKSYGFVWGGDWKSGTDPMHLSWIGEGPNTREKGQANYKARQ